MRITDLQKYRSIITESVVMEASTLNDLGVSQEDISKIHSKLKLEHDVEWEPISTKKALKDALKQRRAVVAVNSEGRAFGLGHYKFPMNSNGQEVLLYDPLNDDEFQLRSVTNIRYNRHI